MHGNSFFNPYMYQPYYQTSNLMNGIGGMRRASGFGRAASGLGNANTGFAGIKGLLGKFSFSSFLNGASKTLNVVNQAIPIFYQVKPIINNARTMFRIMGAVRADGSSTTKNTSQIPQRQSINNSNSNNTTSTTFSSNVADYQTFNEKNPTFFI